MSPVRRGYQGPFPLTDPQRLSRVDANGAPRGSGHRQQTDHDHQCGRRRDDARNTPSTGLGDRQGGKKTERDGTSGHRSDEKRNGRPAEDADKQAPRLCAQRRPDADLTPPLSDDEGHEGVDAGHREEEHDQHHRAQHEAKHVVE